MARSSPRDKQWRCLRTFKVIRTFTAAFMYCVKQHGRQTTTGVCAGGRERAPHVELASRNTKNMVMGEPKIERTEGDTHAALYICRISPFSMQTNKRTRTCAMLPSSPQRQPRTTATQGNPPARVFMTMHCCPATTPATTEPTACSSRIVSGAAPDSASTKPNGS